MVTVSSHNPFRVQPLSPAATGNSINPPPSFHTVAGDDETTLNPLLPDLPSIPEAADQERDLPPIPTEERERNRARQPPRSPVITLDLPPPIHEEQPPAYTATPDIRHGESTLDLGPRRPFQQPRSTRSAASSPRPAQAGLTPSYTGPTAASSSSNFLTPSLTGTPFVQRRRNGHRPGLIQQLAGSLVDQLQNAAFGPSAGDGSVAQSSQGATSAPRHARSFSSFTPSPGPSTSPPPLPPRQTPSAPRLSSNSSGSRDTSPNTISRSTTSTTARSAAVSDFARDFYAAGTADVLIRVDSDLSSDDHHSRNQPRVVDGDISLELRMSSPRSNPRRRNSFDASQIATSSLEPHLQLQPSNSSPSLGTVDDSKPTSIPVPGHPLLRGGKLLVYPKGHTCSKCFNVGYKRGDPSKPCKKCWAKFGKPYMPALLYAPSANATTTLQRPLPLFAQPPPQGSPPMTRAPSAPGAGQQGPARPSGSCGTYQNNSVRSHRHSPSEPPYLPSRPPVGPSIVVSDIGGSVPAGALVYPAGDSRLGGVRCWMCGGTGTVSYFIFDNSQCDTCKGIGRWYM